MKKKQSTLNLKSLVNNRPYLLYSGLISLISLIVLFSGITPQVNNIFDLQRDIKAGDEELKLLSRKTADLENIEAKAAYGSLDSVNKVLPSKKPLLELLTALNLVAEQNNVSFANLSLSPGEISSQSAELLDGAKKTSSKNKKKTSQSKNKEGYDALSVELEVAGLFSDVQKFFIDIEKVAPLTNISSLSLDIKSADIIRASDEVNAELVLQTYFFTQSVTANLDSPLPDIGRKELEIIDEVKSYLYPTANVQLQIQGGGLQDLFGLNNQELEEFL